MKDEDCEDRAQAQLASLKRSMRKTLEDATVRAMHKVMAEFAQGAHIEAKVEHHITMIQCPHCDGSVRVPASKPWVGLTDEEIEKGRDQTFSINNPYCPCDSKTMRKAVRWAEAKLREKNA